MINSRHLPVGQGIPLDTGRSRSYKPHQYQQCPQQLVYPSYMQPYSANYYSQSVPPQYHNSQTSISQLQNQPFIRSPPIQQHIAPLHQQPQVQYARSNHSSATTQLHQINTPHSQTSISSRSSHSSNTIPTSLVSITSKKTSNESIIPPSSEPLVTPFKPPLPWYSRPDLGWPQRRTRKKRRPLLQPSSNSVEISSITGLYDIETSNIKPNIAVPTKSPETSCTNYQSSEKISTNPSTQAFIPPHIISSDTIPTKITAQKLNNPIISIVPALPRSLPRQALTPTTVKGPAKRNSDQDENPAQVTVIDIEKSGEVEEPPEVGLAAPKENKSTPHTKAWVTPKLWAGIFHTVETSSNIDSRELTRRKNVSDSKSTNETSLAEYLKSFDANSSEYSVSFLEPRGLVNAGNMCYMNSILQVLVFCTLFFNFLDQVSKRATYSFKSTTPLLDAMILFMREYSVINSAKSVNQLRMNLQKGDQEKYGEPFAPDFIYNVINQLPRFSSMRRGHQQDAEEFLGFLLEGLHDECIQAIGSTSTNLSLNSVSPTTSISSSTKLDVTQSTSTPNEKSWLEVGPKQKAAVTRSSGIITTETPVTKIFGGNLRSELRVPGLKDSVTMEPYQSLLLDIGAPHVSNIIDALKGLNRSEPLHGDFKSPKGPNVTATKQVFIETLPPVLILHLKRFQYDNTGGTQKIWKKISYPLELELPKEVFPRQKRLAYGKSGLPKYELISAVYHHGKNASVGHYTVDVRRQDGREWIRLDDTVITPIKSEEVAEGGGEEDPKVHTLKKDPRKKKEYAHGHEPALMEYSGNDLEQNGWKQASGLGKKWPTTVNGNSTHELKSEKFSIKDNKVAYLLFYQKI